MKNSAVLVLENSTIFYGQSIGVNGIAVGEVVFNTSMTGYQEIITDPSYFSQIVTMTCPHIGNVGTNKFDNESSNIQIKALVINNLSLISNNFRSTLSLSDFLKKNKIIGISDIDTRKLTRILREQGTQNGCIISGKHLNVRLALNKARNFPGLNNVDLIKKVSTTKKYHWYEGSYNIKKNKNILSSSNFSYHVIVYDYGIKYSIMRRLIDRNCKLTVIPANTSAKKVISMYPDGIFLSNGPGNPLIYNYAINIIKNLIITSIPIFGICLGYQLLALASGAKIIKMKFGHHGNNHPVKDLLSKKIIITSQNHNFIVDRNNLPKELKITHYSLFDNTLQGLHWIDKPIFGFQGHPEASPGPQDTLFLFDYFVELMNNYRLLNKYKKV